MNDDMGNKLPILLLLKPFVAELVNRAINFSRCKESGYQNSSLLYDPTSQNKRITPSPNISSLLKRWARGLYDEI
jgi:hypothetical protein